MKMDHMWELWSLFFDLVALIITILFLPDSMKPIIVAVLSLVFIILGMYTLTRSVQLKGLLAWIQARKTLGICGIYLCGDRQNEKIADHILASNNLKIMALSAEASIRHFEAAIIKALVRRNCNVSVLIAKSGSDFVKEVETLEGSDRIGQGSTEIEHTKTRLKEIIRLANEEAHQSTPVGRIWIGEYNTALRAALIICNNAWGWYTPYLHPKRAIASVSLEIKQASGGLLADCISYFDAVWKLCEEEGQTKEVTLESCSKKP